MVSCPFLSYARPIPVGKNGRRCGGEGWEEGGRRRRIDARGLACPQRPPAHAQAHAPVLGGRRKGRTTDRDGPRKVRPSKRHDVSNLPRSGESLHPAHPQLSPLACPRAAPTPTIRQEGLPDVVPLADRTARAHAHAPPSLSWPLITRAPFRPALLLRISRSLSAALGIGTHASQPHLPSQL